MAISKLIFNGVIQMDVTGTTAGTGDVASGETFVLADGTTGTGSLTPITVNSLSVTQNGTYTASTGTAYSPVTVNVSGGGGDCPWIGPNGVLVQAYNKVSYTLDQTGYATWTPSITRSSIVSAETLGTITMSDINTYDYFFVCFFDFAAAFIQGATLQNTVERNIAIGLSYYAKRFSSINALATGVYDNSGSGTLGQPNNRGSIYYNTNGTKLFGNVGSVAVYSDTSWYPNVSSNVATITTPVIYAQCNNTYFTTERAAELDTSLSKVTSQVFVYKTQRESYATYAPKMISDIYNNPL